MIPAIAIGSAIAILVNQSAEEGEGKAKLRYLMIGVPVMLGLYAAATVGLTYWTGMLDLLVPANAAGTLRADTEAMFKLLIVTFFLVAGGAMLQVILEQLGRGGQVLAITVLTELGTCAALVWLTQNGGMSVPLVANTLIGFAALGFVLFALQLCLMMRKLGGRNAV
jgi:hypothetical protein